MNNLIMVLIPSDHTLRKFETIFSAFLLTTLSVFGSRTAVPAMSGSTPGLLGWIRKRKGVAPVTAWKKILGFFLFFVFISADAALIGRLPATPGGTDYQAYYDTDLGITWAANANLLPSPSGTYNWGDSNDWVASLDIGGVMGWRLPATMYADTTCSNTGNASMGTGCTGSEMGYLFNVEGISAASPGPFSGIQDSSLGYWSATPFLSNSAWTFNFGTGTQSNGAANSPWRYAWAVQTGDVGVVPIPAAVWLFGSGLLGLLGLSRRKR